uniref:Fibronectin type-III domain-containing protein n=1 Tax=Amphimedon queenslandica TaxID=400682 RepID=A0A1X7TLQ6_AMPQE
MATAAGIYWCLVLTGCMNIASVTGQVSFSYTPYPIVCPGDTLVITCVVEGGGAVWKRNNKQVPLSTGQPIPTIDDFTLSITSFDNGVLTSTATNLSAPVQLNESTVSCSADGVNFETLTITLAGSPTIPVNNINIIPITDDTLTINWNTSDPCIDHYTVTINSNNTHNGSNLTDTTNITINDLIIDTNYSFIIIPIDTIGREGPPSSLIQYIWNVPAQVVNISWDQISTDTITIWWNNTPDYSTIPVPPIQYYIINVYNTSNSIIYTNNTTNTNTTITGLPLTDTNYTVTIIPVNIIGYGPSATVNVCPGDRLVLNCVASGTGSAYWKYGTGLSKLLNNNIRSGVTDNGPLTLSVTDIVSNTVTSTGTIPSVDASMNGTMIGCTALISGGFNTFIIKMTGPPVSVSVVNVTITPINNTALTISWSLNTQDYNCSINQYSITVYSNGTVFKQESVNNITSYTVASLIIGANYSFIIIPIDTIGREGPPSSLIQYIWNVPAQVVNISWDQISTDSITIWWNNTQDYSISTIPVPPIQYYIITVYNTSNSIIYNINTSNTNITITGLPLTDTNYTVTIIPVNIIGYGPSATVNVSVASITPTVTSTSSVTNTPSSVTLTDISASTSVRYTSSTLRSSTIYEQSSSFISATGTSAGITTTMSTLSTTTVSTTAAGSNAVLIISGAIGTVFVIIIIIIILVLVILAIKKQRRKKYKISKKEAFSSTDGAVTPTYDEIIVRPTTTTGVPIYDTPMELQANTAYDFSFLSLMATTTGIYWCLVLTRCISLALSASEQSVVCPGVELVFTCVTSINTHGSVIWRLNGNNAQSAFITNDGNPKTLGSFLLNGNQEGSELVSTAINTSAPVSLNGTSIDCSENGGASYRRMYINYPDKPSEAVNDISIIPITNDTLIITWNTSELCIVHYTVTINSNNTLNESRTTDNTNITITSLIIGTNYSFIIIPIDTIGREGPPSSLIQYIWNVPAQVVNISWDQISTDTITIWWNNTQVC